MGDVKCAYSVSGQAEVANVFRLVHRLRHGADHDRLNEVRFLVTRGPLQHLAQIGRLDVPIGRQLNVEALQELAQLLEPVGFRFAMHSEQRWNAMFLQEARRLHVRGDHAFLDQAMRVVAGGFHERCDPALA